MRLFIQYHDCIYKVLYPIVEKSQFARKYCGLTEFFPLKNGQSCEKDGHAWSRVLLLCFYALVKYLIGMFHWQSYPGKSKTMPCGIIINMPNKALKFLPEDLWIDRALAPEDQQLLPPSLGEELPPPKNQQPPPPPLSQPPMLWVWGGCGMLVTVFLNQGAIHLVYT